MTDYIKNLDLNGNSLISLRNVESDYSIHSIDIDQVDGRILVTERDNNSITLYPQSPQLQMFSPVRYSYFTKFGRLSLPSDAKVDYVRRKIWIADTGNDRILKMDINSEVIDIGIDDIFEAHALAADINTGGVFVKAYTDDGKKTGIIHYLSSSGVEILNFKFEDYMEYSSSSSSSSSGEDVETSSSSSGEIVLSLPPPYTMAYDHVRSRVWWINSNKIYMADIKNNQVKTYGLGGTYTEALSVDIDLETGNAFIIAVSSAHNEYFVLQMSRDNNTILARAYILE